MTSFRCRRCRSTLRCRARCTRPVVERVGGQIVERRWIGVTAALLVRLEQVPESPDRRGCRHRSDAFIADENRRPGNQLAHVVLALAAERAIESLRCRRRSCVAAGASARCAGARFGPLRSWRTEYSNFHSRKPSRSVPEIRCGWFRRPCTFKASRRACAMTFASRKSRMGSPLHRRTEKIGACVADPFANGEGAREIDTFTIPKGAGGGCINPDTKLAVPQRGCQPAEFDGK